MCGRLGQGGGVVAIRQRRAVGRGRRLVSAGLPVAATAIFVWIVRWWRRCPVLDAVLSAHVPLRAHAAPSGESRPRPNVRRPFSAPFSFSVSPFSSLVRGRVRRAMRPRPFVVLCCVGVFFWGSRAPNRNGGQRRLLSAPRRLLIFPISFLFSPISTPPPLYQRCNFLSLRNQKKTQK